MKTQDRAQIAPGTDAGPGTLITIPAGANHHVRNPGSTPLFVLTVYAPPEY